MPSSPSTSRPTDATAGAWWACLVLALAVAAAYSNTIHLPFIFDDRPAIVENATIRDWRAIGMVLSPPNDGSSVTGRPVVNLSLALDYALGGTAPWSYHVTNLLIHVLATLALFGCARRTFLQPILRGRFSAHATPLAAVIALWWALHPLQTESVTAVVQRTESLAGLFYLLTLYGFIRAMEPGATRPWRVIALVACLAGMATKEVMVSAPLLLLLYDRTFVAGSFRGAWQNRKSWYGLLAATWLLLALLVVHQGGSRGNTDGAPVMNATWHYLLTQCDALVTYVRLTFWPHPLVLDYGTPLVTRVGEVWLAGVMVLGALVAVAASLWRWPVAGFFGACFFVLLAPSSSVVPLVTQPIAEHRMYLPTAALVAVAIVVGYRLIGRRVLLAGVVLGLAAGLAAFTRNRDYVTEESIWRDTIAKRPNNARAYYNLGCALEAHGQLPSAFANYETALRMDPNYADAHNNLGRILSAQGRHAEALQHLTIAAQRKPASADIQGNLGIALLRAGRVDEAIDHLQRTIRARPTDDQALGWLGSALLQKQRLAEAAACYTEMARLKPDRADAHVNLGTTWLMMGNTAAGIAELQRGLQLDPDEIDGHRNLALHLARSGKPAEAIPHWREVLRLQPDDAMARAELERAVAATKR
jgi:protein O-mannosyl-transferase